MAVKIERAKKKKTKQKTQPGEKEEDQSNTGFDSQTLLQLSYQGE